MLIVGAGWSPAVAIAGGQEMAVSIEPRLRSVPSRSGRHVPSPNFRVNSNLVLIPVNVVDILDRQVLGLAKEQFRIYDDDVEQSITHFASDDAPVSVAIVFDASASMGPKLKKSREAVAEILKTANPSDEFALIQFDKRVQRLVNSTVDGGEILNRLSSIQPRGQTALLDAVYFATNTMSRARHARKAIVVISDGGDNCSRYSILEMKQMVREADAQIFAICIVERPGSRLRTPEEIGGPALLRSIAEETGGRMFLVEKPDELTAIAARIGSTLRHEYLIGYSPPEMARDGKYHSVKVKVDGTVTAVRLFWRLGYYAPERW